MTKIFLLYLICFMVCITTLGCGDKALFDELATNRLKVVLKGTFESNNPKLWTGEYPQDDSVDDYNNSSQDVNPGFLRMDIAELKIVDGTLKHKQFFADNRQTYLFSLIDDDPFFNGTGVFFSNDDVRPDFPWVYITMFIRKMIFDSGKEYFLNGDDDNGFNGIGQWELSALPDLQTTFNEELVYGFDFNGLQINSYYDSLLNSSTSVNRIFPLIIPIEDALFLDNEEEGTVLEIRMVVKNYVKKYEYDYYHSDDGIRYFHYIKHYYALSDWLRDVKEERRGLDAYGNIKYYNEAIGGNLITVARTYIIGRTVTLTGNAGVSNCYVVAINNTHDISQYIVNDRTRPGCDEPKQPDLIESELINLPDDLEYVLNNYLKYEKYKSDYNNFIECVNSSEYEASWNEYNSRISSFKIPPLVTWTDDGEFVLENVPVGYTYKIYYSNDTSTGELPEVYNYIGNISVSLEQAGQTLSIP